MNVIALLLVLALAAAAAAGFYLLNRRTVDVPYQRDSGYRLGGWTIVLGLTLVAAAAIHTFNLFAGGYFSTSAYAVWVTHGPGFMAMVLAELIFAEVWMFSSLALVYWYLKRRDIFPSMFMGYVALLIVTQATLFLLYNHYGDQAGLQDAADQATKQLFRLFVYGAVWCSYLVKSERVKGTFLKAYDQRQI